MKNSNKVYFIEVYSNEFGNSENKAELVGQEEYPSLLAAYDAAKDIPKMYSGLTVDHLEIVDSEDLNRVYYTFSTFNGGKIHEPELQEIIDERNNTKAENSQTVEVGSTEVKKFEVGKIYHLDIWAGDKFKVIKIENGFVTFKQIAGTSDKTRRCKIRIMDFSDTPSICNGRIFEAVTIRGGYIYAIDEVIEEIDAGADTQDAAKAVSEVEIENAKAEKAGAVRKEISKDDYRFFIGRIEKIGNGQVGFIADTQKKAVELLEKEIPQNVIDATDNRKAFNIWLGKEINPIIVTDSGYKEEIRVIGDSYDFFEVKAEIENAKAENKEVSEMKSFRIYLKTWNHILENIVTAQVVNAINKEINPADWQESEKVLIYKNCNLSGEEIEKIREAVTKINCRFVLEEVEMENAAISENVESENMTADVGEEFNNIAEEITPSIDDEIFAQAEFINKEAEWLVRGAAACKYGDLTIEGKLVTLPDKKGRPRYYRYCWDNIRDYACETSLTPISEEEARKIAAQWHLAFSPMTFEEYMAASNAEYKKIRTIYIKEGGAIVRQYDKDLADEIENSEEFNAKIISCLDLYFVNSDDAAAVEESNAISAYWDAADKWSKESDAILEKTVYAALQNGNSIKLFKQGCTNLEECIELIDCYTLTKKDAEIPRTFCSDMYEEGGEVTFTPVSPKGVSYSLADYKTKEQFQAVAAKLSESIQRGDKQFIFPTIEELNAPAAVNSEYKKFEVGKVYSARYVEEYELFGSVSDKHFEVIDLIMTKFNKKVVVVKNDCGEISKCNVHYSYSKEQEWITPAEGQLILLADDVFNHTAENPLKEKIANLRATEKIISEKYLSLCRNLYVKIDGEYQSAFGLYLGHGGLS